jgi:NAD(P)-dependent dehydrogenase (short-subunit alcohol dehydrogenase family)
MANAEKGAVLVTGAAQRIGRAIALDLGRRDFPIAIHHHRSANEAEDLAAEIRKTGGIARTFAADLADPEAVMGLVPAAAAALGPIGTLINNAACFEHDTILNATLESWTLHLDVNLRAPFFLAQSFVRALPKGMDGNIINLIDMRVWKPTPHFASYTVSKGGLWMLTQTLAMALAPRIRVNGIGPGPTLPSAHQSDSAFARQTAALPLRRAPTPADITAGVRYILEAKSLTGQMLALDGGQHLPSPPLSTPNGDEE